MEDNTNITQENNGANNAQAQANQVDYAKIEEIVSKNVERKENAVLKSYFEQKGLKEEEVAEAIKNYKETKEKEKDDLNKSYEDLQNKYNDLLTSLENQKIDSAINLVCAKNGFDEKQIAMVSKLIDKSNLKNEAGEIDEIIDILKKYNVSSLISESQKAQC